MCVLSLNRVSGACAVLAAAGLAQAQPQVTVVPGFTWQSWNAGTNVVENIWRPEAFGASWNNGLRWDWHETDGMGGVVIPQPMPVFDPGVPGITKAYQFPGARGATILPDGTGNRGVNWENNATAGESGTLELWFKANDLDGRHVLWEIGATNKGAAFELDGGNLITAVRTTDSGNVNTFSYTHSEPINAGQWYQAVLVINFASFTIDTYLNGVEVDSQPIPTPSATYRWTGANPAGLGMIGADPGFPGVGIAGDDPDGIIPVPDRTPFDGMIAIHRFYDVDLFPDEIADNYDAITDAGAVTRRSDFDQSGTTDLGDQFAFMTWFGNSTSVPTGGVEFPFPSSPGGGVQTNDPALDETILGDFIANRDGGFNPTGAQEPSYQFPALNVLEPVNIYDTAFPSIRTAWEMNGLEGLRGPKLEQSDDTSALRAQFWLHLDDVTGNHCLYEAGGDAAGFSLIAVGDQLFAALNTRAEFNPATPTAPNEVEISSGPGVLTPGWHHFDIVCRRFITDLNGDGMQTDADLGQGFEIYVDGVQVAAINDTPGPDMLFGTADDVNVIDYQSNNNSNFVGGNQSGYCQVQGSIRAHSSVDTGSLTPFNGMAGPIRIIQNQPAPSEIAAQFAAESAQVVIDGRNDFDADGAATFFDAIQSLKMIDAGR